MSIMYCIINVMHLIKAVIKSVILINLLILYYKCNIYKMLIMYCIINVMHLKKNIEYYIYYMYTVIHL